MSPKNLFTFIQMRGDVSDANTKALDESLAEFPNAKAQTREQFVDAQISGLKSILNILYVLLALSVVVSLFGIVNTLVLTVFERTRELGMLRAIGMTRRQVRRMIRHESVITALIGAALGIALGVVLGGLLVARIDFIEFALPVLQLVIFAIAAVVVGIVAALFPARRAARLPGARGASVRIARAATRDRSKYTRAAPPGWGRRCPPAARRERNEEHRTGSCRFWVNIARTGARSCRPRPAAAS